MPALKRSAPSASSEGDGDVLQDTSNKRIRVNGNGHAEDDTDGMDESGDAVNGKQNGVSNGHAAKAEDQEAEHEEEEDEEDELNEEGEDEEMEAAMVEEMRTQQGDARDNPSEAGVIDKVDLKNFMCHKHLTMKLGQQLNFVIGHNGSGKSAILTGITIALGGKASNTNRGSSLKSFVREGSDHAEVILTMRNEGPEAFKPHLYGKRLVIERRIAAAGPTTWKLKSFAGKVVSTKREEIDAYCDHTNIQVDNPMNVLSQDAARQFLSSSHAKDKYTFFLKGTQLNQLAHEYDTLKKAIDSMSSQVAKHEASLPALEEHVRETMERYKVLDKARSQKEELHKLQEQMVWSQVIAKEQEVEKHRELAEKAKEKLEMVQEDITKKEAELEELDTAIQEVEEQAKASRDREQPLHDARKAVIQEIKAHTARAAQFKVDGERLNEQFEQHEEEIQRLQKQIDDEAARLAVDKRDQIAKLTAERDDCKQKLEDYRTEEESKREELAIAEERDVPLRQRWEELNRELARVHRTIEEQDDQIARLKASKTQKLHAYGPNTLAILRAIDQRSDWARKPIGPIGAFVQVRDKQWCRTLEAYLNNVLGSYLVTNFNDQQKLAHLLRQMNIHDISIITAPDDQFDFSSGEPDTSILTVRRALEVSEQAVLRALVNNSKIEKAALVLSRIQGDQLVRQTPRNVAYAISADLFRVSGGARGSSTQTMQEYRGVPRLTSDFDEAIRQCQEAHSRAVQEKRQIDGQLHDLKQERNANEKAKNDLKAVIPQFARKIRQMTTRLQEIEEEFREDEPANVAALQENKDDVTREQAKVLEQFKAIAEQEREAKARLKPLADQAEQMKQQIISFTESRGTFANTLELKTPIRMKVFSALAHRKDQLERKREEHEDAQLRFSELEAELESWTEQAAEFCPRVEAPLSAAEYQKKISAIEKHAEKAKRRGAENIDDVLEELYEHQQALREAQKVIEDVRDLCKMFEGSLARRQTRWQEFRKLIALRARYLFTQNLEHRGYSGSLSFDHDGQKLRLRVQTEDTTKARRDKDPKSLSGGEKSFATICLLLSLWEAIGCPIRCLDEFDVFMDAVNRKISMKMIADMAKKNPGTQFCLITPLNMANVNFGPEVRILRMSDPERGQGVLQAGNSG